MPMVAAFDPPAVRGQLPRAPGPEALHDGLVGDSCSRWAGVLAWGDRTVVAATATGFGMEVVGPGKANPGSPVWPLGLPRWDDPWLALGLRGEADTLLTVFRRLRLEHGFPRARPGRG